MLTRLKAVWQADIVQATVAVGIRLAGGLAGYALFAVVARVIGPMEFGGFSVLFSVAMLAGTLASFGQQVFLVKEIPRAREQGDDALELGTYIFSAVSTVAAAFSVSLFLARVLAHDSWQVGRGDIVATALLTGVFAVSQTTIGALRVQSATLFAITTRDLVWRLGSISIVAGIGGIAASAAKQVDTVSVVGAMVIVLIPIVALHILRVVKQLTRRFNSVVPRFELRRWLGVSAGLAIVGGIASGDAYAFTVVLGRVLTEVETGAYFASLKSVEAVNLFLMAVTLVVAPELSTAVARDDANLLQRKCNSAFLMQAVPAIFSCGLMLVLAEVLLGMFATEFIQYSNLLRVLALAMLFNALTGSTVLLLQLGGLHWLQVWLQGGALVGAMLLIPLTAPFVGVMAAGLAFFASKAAWNVAAIVAIRRRFGVDPSLVGFVRNGGAGMLRAWTDLLEQLREARS